MIITIDINGQFLKCMRFCHYPDSIRIEVSTSKPVGSGRYDDPVGDVQFKEFRAYVIERIYPGNQSVSYIADFVSDEIEIVDGQVVLKEKVA